MTVLSTAQAYLRAGFSVIPIGVDGEKQPAFDVLPRDANAKATWNPFRDSPASDEQARQWWESGRYGIAFVGGAVSGGLEVIDFDLEAETQFSRWLALVRDQWPALLERIGVVETPRPGYHVWLRCGGIETPGNLKLAQLSKAEQAAEKALAKKEDRKAEYTLIETRGEGGYALVPGCPVACHKSGKRYVHHAGCALTELPDLSMDERDFLFACARSLTRDVPAPEPTPKSAPGNDLRPGEDFERRGWDWSEILGAHGWTLAGGSEGSERRWRRPGKSHGWSATTGHCASGGADLFHCFTTGDDRFEGGKNYGKFRAYCLLNHAGDYRAAAKDLAERGFGAPRRTTSGKQSSPPQEPPAEADAPQPQEAEGVVICLDDVVAERVSWLWHGWLPLGELCILDGDPGLGKSGMTLDVAARLSRGDSLPPHEGRDLGRGPCATLLLGAEDSLAHTVRPRLDAMGANCKLIHSLEAMTSGTEGDTRPVILPRDLERMAAFIVEKNVKLVVVDPLMAYLSSDTDAHKDQDVRRCLRPLSQLAGKLGIVVLLVRHLNKLAGGPALYRGGSSIGITGAARASLIVGRDPQADRHILAMNKLNVGPKPPSLAYKLETAGLAYRIVWDGECDLRPDQILGHGPPRAADEPGQKRGRPADSLDEARRFLADLLAGGAVDTADIKRHAESASISWRTAERARADMGIDCKKEGKIYVWRLPSAGRQAGTQNSGGPDVPDEENDVSNEGDYSSDDPPIF